MPLPALVPFGSNSPGRRPVYPTPNRSEALCLHFLRWLPIPVPALLDDIVRDLHSTHALPPGELTPLQKIAQDFERSASIANGERSATRRSRLSHSSRCLDRTQGNPASAAVA